MKISYLLFVGLITISIACNKKKKSDQNALGKVYTPVSQFGDYWYQGKAELTSYRLKQARYGEYREGTSVLIFVTEPFSKTKQVKLDNPSSSNDDEVTVMKLNFTKKFLTGIYPYSMMTSSFVPVSINQYPDILKVSTTSQEWCGHTFTQLNYKNGKYLFQQFSYFESEGDLKKNFKAEWIEDEIWQRIRINPASLPQGELKMFPGTMFLRLSHDDPEPEEVKATLSSVPIDTLDGSTYQQYSLEYSNRMLEIFFEKDFPHNILGWNEYYGSSPGKSERMKTEARKIKSILSPYWNKNSNENLYLRDSLGLPAGPF